MILIYKDNLPLFAWINSCTNDLFDSIFEQEVSPNFDLLDGLLISITMICLDSVTQYSKHLCSDLEVIHPRHIRNQVLSHHIRDL